MLADPTIGDRIARKVDGGRRGEPIQEIPDHKNAGTFMAVGDAMGGAIAPIPEPGSAVLLAIGAAGRGLRRKKRRNDLGGVAEEVKCEISDHVRTGVAVLYRTMSIVISCFCFGALLVCTDAQAEPVAAGPVKVFILAGQSNMVGHGRVEIGHDDVPNGSGKIGSLRYQVNNDPANYGHLVDSSGNWITRSDVWVWSTGDGGEKGNLTVGFGAADFNIGPEFGFGHVIGDLYDEQVLLIKTAWGGKSLGADFRPPTAVANRGGSVGSYYNEILNVYNNVVDNIATEFPDYNGQGVELVGMGWHQGYNDRFNTDFANEYEANLVDLIKDIRNDLGAPDLPFVIAETGNGGYGQTGTNPLKIMAAQAAAADPIKYPDFEGNVAFVETRGFWRDISVSPTTAGHHWNANGESYYLMGNGMGTAMEAMIIPEPGTLLLLVTGSLALLRRR